MGSKVTKSPGKNNSKIRLVSWLHFLMCLSFNAPFTTWFFLKPYLTILYLPNCLIGLIYILLGGFRKIYWNPKIVWLKTSLYMEVFIYFLQESFTVLLWIQCIYSILIKVFFCLQRSRVIYGVLPHQSIQLDHLTRTAQDIIIIIIIIISISINIKVKN